MVARQVHRTDTDGRCSARGKFARFGGDSILPSFAWDCFGTVPADAQLGVEGMDIFCCMSPRYHIWESPLSVMSSERSESRHLHNESGIQPASLIFSFCASSQSEFYLVLSTINLAA